MTPIDRMIYSMDEERFIPSGRVDWIRGHGRGRCGADGCGLERCRFLMLHYGISSHTAEQRCHSDVINHKTKQYVYAESDWSTVGIEFMMMRNQRCDADCRPMIADVKKSRADP